MVMCLYKRKNIYFKINLRCSDIMLHLLLISKGKFQQDAQTRDTASILLTLAAIVLHINFLNILKNFYIVSNNCSILPCMAPKNCNSYPDAIFK